MNTFGTHFTFTSFGESHGRAIGGVLDGVPAGLRIDLSMIRAALDRRAARSTHTPSTIHCAEGAPIPPSGGTEGDFPSPLQGGPRGASPRAQRETDEVEWLSGVIDGMTIGTPIAFLIRNTDARSEDYEWLKHTFRPGHADFTYQHKYGIRDYRGGGRASARETAARVVAGNIAQQLLMQRNITIHAQLVQVGEETDPQRFSSYLSQVRAQGDSIGGIVQCTITGMPIGAGEPIFDKLQAHLAFAIMSINACKGFDYGSGFAHVHQSGSQLFLSDDSTLVTGGIAGGITDGTPITFRCVFKPTPSSAAVLHCAKGALRMDTCVAVRAVPVVEAMTALVLCDFIALLEQSK